MKSIIETATGPISPSQLGRVLMHEHVFVVSTEIQQNYPQEWGDEQARIDDAVDRLTELKENGIETIVDPTAIGLGRYIPRIQAVANRIDLNIVCATGLYTFNELPHYYRRRTSDNVDALTTHFVQDIVDGFADTGVKAGVIKCATDKPGLTPDVERVGSTCTARIDLQVGSWPSAPLGFPVDFPGQRTLLREELATTGSQTSTYEVSWCPH